MAHARLEPGDIVGGRYTIAALLGRGAHGAVYRALDPVGGVVALKVIAFDPQTYAGDLAEFSGRVEREIKALRRLNSPSVVRLHDWGTEGETIYLAMEYLEGHTLEELSAGARLPAPQAVRLCLQILRGLMDAHAAGVVHRDLKPANIMVVPRQAGHDEIRILDFGVARLAVRGQATFETANGERIFGTPAYMAPEQGLGTVLPQSDLYAVGTMLFELLAGRLPFAGIKPLQLMLRKIKEPLPTTLEHLGVPPDVIAVVRRAMARRPVDRFADAGAMYRALAAARLAEAPVADFVPEAVDLPRVEVRRTVAAPVVGPAATDAQPAPSPGRLTSARAAIRRWLGTPRRVLLAVVMALSAAAGLVFFDQGAAPRLAPQVSAPSVTHGGQVDDPFLTRSARLVAHP